MPTDTPTPAADKHSPAPWRVGNDEDNEFGCVIDGDGNMIADCGISDLPLHMDAANAALIAAAPDMLAALRMFRDFANSGAAFNYPLGSLQALDAAIAKAVQS